jgi:hypothetical protein
MKRLILILAMVLIPAFVFAGGYGQNPYGGKSGGGSSSGSGDVTGPAGATSGNVAKFADATGKVLSDGGTLATDNSTANNLVAKDSDGHIENLTLDGHLSRTGTTSPALAVVTPSIIYHAAGDTAPTAAQMTGPGLNVSNYDQGAEDVFVPLPAAAANLSGKFDVVTAQANHWGVVAGAGDRAYLVNADGTISDPGSDATAIVMTAAQFGQSFACWTQKTGASSFDWFCKAIAIGTSTFAAHAAP